MSSIPNVTDIPSTAQVTAVPAVVNDFNKPLDELRQAAFSTETATPAAAPVETTPPAAPAPEPQGDYQVVTTDQGVEIRLASGEIFKAKTEAEAWPKVAAAKVQSERFIKELKKQQATPAVQPTAPTAPQRLDNAAFEQQYWTIASTQGLEAAENFKVQQRPELVLNTFAKALGLQSGDELQAMLGNIRQTTETVNGNMIAAQFHAANPDFPATPEASDALVDYAVKNGLNPADPRHLTIAHAACLREKVYAPAAVAPAAITKVTPPPMVTPTGNSPAAKVADEKSLWGMPINDLRKQTFGR